MRGYAKILSKTSRLGSDVQGEISSLPSRDLITLKSHKTFLATVLLKNQTKGTVMQITKEKMMITSTRTINTEIFALIAILDFQLLTLKVLC